MEELPRNGTTDVFHQRRSSRGQLPFDMVDTAGRGIRASILGGMDDDFSSRNHQVSRTRVHTLDPSFALEPLQRANSTPPYSGPVPISSRDLPKSGLNPYPQSRTPQLQSSGHFTTSSREDPLLTGLRDLNIGPSPSEMGRKVSSNSFVSNFGTGYASSGSSKRSVADIDYGRSSQTYDDYDTHQDDHNSQWQNQYQRTGTPNEFEHDRRPSPFFNAPAQTRTHISHQSTDYPLAQTGYPRDPLRQPVQARAITPIHGAHPAAVTHHPVLLREPYYRPQFQPAQFTEYTNGYQAPFVAAPFVAHPGIQQVSANVRRHEDSLRNLRSPLLEEFRSAKTKKFELKVHTLIMTNIRTFLAILLSLVVTSMGPVSFNRNSRQR
jgi:hypothetical protein